VLVVSKKISISTAMSRPFSFTKVAPIVDTSVSRITSGASCKPSREQQSGPPKDCVFVPKDVPTRLCIKKDVSGKKQMLWSLKQKASVIKRRMTSTGNEEEHEDTTITSNFLSILNEEKEPVAYIRRKKQDKSIILMDEANHEAFVFCKPQQKHSFAIYSRRPLTTNAQDVLSAVQYEGDVWFPWLMVSNVHVFPIFHVWSGHSFIGPTHSPTLVIDNKPYRDRNELDESMLKIMAGHRVLCSSTHGKGSDEWNLHLEAGADPAMMLILSVVLSTETFC